MIRTQGQLLAGAAIIGFMCSCVGSIDDASSGGGARATGAGNGARGSRGSQAEASPANPAADSGLGVTAGMGASLDSVPPPSLGAAGAAGVNGAIGAQPRVHRLNRFEYNNTVADLLGTMARPADDFAADSSSAGFDHLSGAQSTSSVHIEQYLAAAEGLIGEALGTKTSGAPKTFHYDLDDSVVQKQPGQDNRTNLKQLGDGFWSFGGSDEFRVLLKLPGDGEYDLAVTGSSPLQSRSVMFSVDELPVVPIKVGSSLATYRAAVSIKGGLHVVAMGAVSGTAGEDLFKVKSFDITGPRASDPMAVNGRPRLLSCVPGPTIAAADCARQILTGFATRAWRRPLARNEVDSLKAVYDGATGGGSDFSEAVATALKAVLVSPNFLYRIEAAPPSSGVRRLGGYELASRLSYFLWSSMPDDRLFELAAQGGLEDPRALEAQVDRLLADKRSAAFTQSFAGQWLFLRSIDTLEKDRKLYPSFDTDLRGSMRREADAFFRSFVDEPRSVLEMLTSQESFLDDRLRAHYGIPRTGKAGLARSATGGKRAGLLGQAGLLSVLATGVRTAPVGRGKWVASQLLCQPPPPPPPDVTAQIPEQKDGPPATMRQLMQAHVVAPSCAACHRLLDPMGLALEHFDAVGAWRDTDHGLALDTTGQLPNGATFDGGVALGSVLARDAAFPRCLVHNLVTYALAAIPDSSDEPRIDRLIQAFTMGGLRLGGLIKNVVTSDLFTTTTPR